jgi:hypothetical protein
MSGGRETEADGDWRAAATVPGSVLVIGDMPREAQVLQPGQTAAKVAA